MPTVYELESRLCFSALFTAAPGPPISIAGAYGAVVGDFNGDGNPDVAVSFNGGLTTLLGDGNGGFSPGPQTIPGLLGVVSAGHFSDNGKLGIAATAATVSQPYQIAAYLGNGDATFSTAPGSPIVLDNPPVGTIAAGDLTGNGRTDLVWPDLNGQDLTILLSNSDGSFTTGSVPLGFSGQSVALGDFNGDGNLDIAVGGTAPGVESQVEVFLGDGNGHFTPTGSILTGFRYFVSGDFTNNGRPDLAALSEQGVTVLQNLGGGILAPIPGKPAAVGNSPSNLVVGDFTGNGNEDLAVDNAGDGTTSVLLGDGNGRLKPARGSPFKGDVLTVGAFDGSSEPDLLLREGNNDVRVLLNTSPYRLPTGTLGETFFSGSASGTANIGVTAPASHGVKGQIRIAFYAAPDKTLFDATQVGPATAETVNLKPGGGQSFNLPLPSLAGTGFAGENLIAVVTAPNGTTTGVVGPLTAVTSVVASGVTFKPASVKPGGNLTVSFLVQNAGNQPVAGSANLTISLSTNPSGAGGAAAATVALRVKTKPGQSRPYLLRIRVPKTTPAGNYYVVASLAVSALGDGKAADGIAVSAMPIVVR